MSLVTTKGIIDVPTVLLTVAGSNTDTLNAANEQVANVIQIYKAGNIRKIIFRCGTVGGDGNVITGSIQGIDASGYPDGTAAGSSTASVGSAQANTWVTIDFGAEDTVAVTQGQNIAVVLKATTYAADIQIRRGLRLAQIPFQTYQCTDLAAAGWARGTANSHTLIGLEYDDGTYGVNSDIGPFMSASHTLSTGTTPDKIGNRIKLPYPARAIGIWINGDFDYAMNLSLTDDSNTELANCSVDTVVRMAVWSGYYFVPFDSNPAATVNIAKDTFYRVTATPTSASNVSMSYIETSSAAAMDSLSLGQYCYAITKAGAGEWATDTAKRYYIGLILDQLDDGAGMIVHPGMTGGLNG